MPTGPATSGPEPPWKSEITWLRARGYAIPTVVETRLHDYLLSYLRHDHAPDFYSHSMRATIHAVVLAALAVDGRAGAEATYRPGD